MLVHRRVLCLKIIDERKSGEAGVLEDDGNKKGREEEREGEAIA